MLLHFKKFLLVDRLIDLLILEDVGYAVVDLLVVEAALRLIPSVRARVDGDRRTFLPLLSDPEA